MSPITQTPIPLSDEWATPKWLFDHFDAEFHFTLDGAAQSWNAKCARFCSPDDHGPAWSGEVVWLNPPYSELGAWMWKAGLAARRIKATVVCLVPCVPDRKWWSEHVEGKAEVRHLTRSLLPTGRIHFEKEDGTSGRAPFASCLVIYKPA